MEKVKSSTTNRMKRFLVLSLLMLLGTHMAYPQFRFKRSAESEKQERDIILKRDGSELIGTVRLVTATNTFLLSIGNDSPKEVVEDNGDIYMIKFQERGNLFFNEYGGLFFGDGDGIVPDDATAIYLTQGEEIVAYKVIRDMQGIRYTLSKKSDNYISCPLDEIFAVKYPNMPYEVKTMFTKPNIDNSSYINIPISRDEFVELVEAKPAEEYVIKTKKNATIRALVVYGNDTFVSFYKKDAPKGPIYRLDRKDIKTITKAVTKKPRITRKD